MPENDNKRAFIRVPGEFPVTCELYSIPRAPVSAAAEGVLRNISAGGLLFHSARAFRKGETVRLKVDIPDWENRKPEFFKPVKLSEAEMFLAIAEVVRCEASAGGFEIAAKFIAIDDGHQLALDKLARHENRRLKENP